MLNHGRQSRESVFVRANSSVQRYHTGEQGRLVRRADKCNNQRMAITHSASPMVLLLSWKKPILSFSVHSYPRICICTLKSIVIMQYITNIQGHKWHMHELFVMIDDEVPFTVDDVFFLFLL